MNVKNVAKAYNKTKLFNEIAGQLENITKESIASQLDYIQSEYLETVEAFDNLDQVELLDGAIDMFVTVVGLMQKLEVSGYNVEEALKRVCDNNLEKFVPVGEHLSYDNTFTATINNNYQVRVIRDASGKVRKHKFFKPVALDDLVPTTFFN